MCNTFIKIDLTITNFLMVIRPNKIFLLLKTENNGKFLTKIVKN